MVLITPLGAWQDFASNAGSATTTWYYDQYRGWLEKKVYQGETDTTLDYEYLASGRLWKRHWERGVSTIYSYNNAGDLAGADYSDSTPDVAYAYDRRGRQKSIAQGSMTTALTYNDANEVLTETYTGGTLNGLSVTNAYDTYLRRTNLTARNGATLLASATNSYDAASRLATLSDGTNSATYTYLANSPLVTNIVFKQNGTTRMTTIKNYDFLNRLASISSSPSSSSSSSISFGYVYNSANQRSRRTEADSSYWVYQYDNLGQVMSGKKYWTDGTPVPGQQFEYAHDDIGNRKSTKTGGDSSGAGLRPASYAVNTVNQYTSRDVPNAFDVLGASYATNSVTVNASPADYRRGEYFQELVPVVNSSTSVWQMVAVTNSGGGWATGSVFVAKTPEAFYYDLDGNLTNDGRWTYTWDAENRLTQVESLSSSPTASKRKVIWEYDGKGRRVRQTTYDGSSGSYVLTEDLKFLSDGWRHIAELNAANNALLRSYVWGLDLSGSLDGAGGVGGLLILNSVANGAHFYAYDGNGNVVALVKASDGTVSAVYEYEPFGKIIRSTGAMADENSFGFSTKRTHRPTRVVLYEFRPYDADQGRWPSRDPLGEPYFAFMTGLEYFDTESGPNAYAFVENDGLNQCDYLGLQTTWPRPKPPPSSPDTYPARPEQCDDCCPHGTVECKRFEVSGSILTTEVPGIAPWQRDVHWLCFTPCQDPWIQGGETSLYANPIPSTPKKHPWPFYPVTQADARARIPNPPGPPPGRPADGEFCFWIPWTTWQNAGMLLQDMVKLRGWCMKCGEDTP